MPRHKYNAVRTEVNGRKYASKAEGRYAAQLASYQKAELVVGWLEQVPFKFPDGNKYVADFLVFYENGEAELVDIKGMVTPTFKIKQKMMAKWYPWIPLVVIPGKDVK